MDLEKIAAYNEQQQTVAAENAKTEDMAFALKSILDSQKDIEDSVKESIVRLIQFVSQHKPEVSVINQQPFPSYEEVVKAVNQVVEEVKNSNKSLATVEQKEADYTPVLKSLDKLAALVEKLPTKMPQPVDTVEVSNQPDYSGKFDEVTKAVGKLKLSPTISVAAPKIPPVDVSPIVEALKTPSEEIDLSSFKAQDITGDDSFQYVGFMAPTGNWYIIENDISGGKLRFKFGSKNYLSAWRSHVSQEYKLLNEAIREIQA